MKCVITGLPTHKMISNVPIHTFVIAEAKRRRDSNLKMVNDYNKKFTNDKIDSKTTKYFIKDISAEFVEFFKEHTKESAKENYIEFFNMALNTNIQIESEENDS